MRSAATPIIISEDLYAGGPVLTSRGGRGDGLTARRIKIDAADPDVAAVWGERPGYVARVFLAATPPCTLFRSGRALQVPSRRASETAVRETGSGYVWPILYPIDVIKFEMPAAALKQWAHDDRRVSQGRLNLRTGTGTVDNALLAFGRASQQCLADPRGLSQFFVDHLLAGVCAYLFPATDDANIGPAGGGLAPWQMRRAKDLIDSRIGSDLTLEELAVECGLSVAHLTRAFRRSVGESPHQWLLRRRIDRAQWLLTHTEKDLVEIAFDCGFFDQAHFTNAFRRRTGASPGAFRRQHLALKSCGGSS